MIALVKKDWDSDNDDGGDGRMNPDEIVSRVMLMVHNKLNVEFIFLGTMYVVFDSRSIIGMVGVLLLVNVNHEPMNEESNNVVIVLLNYYCTVMVGMLIRK